MKRRDRIQKKGNRHGRVLVRNIIALCMLFTIFSFLTNVEFGKKDTKTNEIIVESHDTIWNIASGICQEKDNLNVQNIIIEIKQINHLSTSDIYVGQTLSIPIY